MSEKGERSNRGEIRGGIRGKGKSDSGHGLAHQQLEKSRESDLPTNRGRGEGCVGISTTSSTKPDSMHSKPTRMLGSGDKANEEVNPSVLPNNRLQSPCASSSNGDGSSDVGGRADNGSAVTDGMDFEGGGQVGVAF